MIRWTVLGSCGTYPAPGRACSGYLLEAEGDSAGLTRTASQGSPARSAGGDPVKVWVDTGSGTLSNLLRTVRLDELDAIWVSHLHVDHCSDLPVAYYALKFGDVQRDTPLPVFGPTGWGEHMGRFLTSDSERTMADLFEVNVLGDGERVSLGGLRLTAVATRHSVETYGVRAEAGGSTLAYSADTGPCDALERLAQDADLFVCEAAWADRPETDPIHCNPQDAGEWASRAAAKRLVLTHLRPSANPLAAVELAGEVFDGEIGVALEGDVYDLGATR